MLANTGLNIGELTAFMQYLTLVVTPLAMVAIVIPFLLRGDASAGRMFEVYDALPAVEDKPDSKPLAPADIKGRVVFDNVSFAFRRTDGAVRPACAQEYQPRH